MKLAAATFALQLLAPPTPARSVELRVSAVDEGEALLLEQSLERELGDRLLEDGHRLVPAGAAASVQVWIHVDREVTTIEVRGRERRLEPVPSGPRELVGLEIQQLTSALVDDVGAAERVDERDASPEPRALILELVGRDDAAMRGALQSGLLARGHALARVPVPGDLRVCVELDGERGEGALTIVDAALPCPAPTPAGAAPATALPPERVRERLLDRTQALLDAREPPPPASAPLHDDDAVQASPPAPTPTPTPSRPRPNAKHSLALAAHAGAVARSGGPIDPVFGAGLRAGRRLGIGGGLEASVVPSRATDLRVVETMAQGVLDGRIALGRRGAVEGVVMLGVLAGVHIHHYRQTVVGGNQATLAAPSVATVARAALLRGGLLVFGGLRAGWSGGRWVHLGGGKASWRRSASFVGLELGVGWDWAWRTTTKAVSR